MAKKRRGLTVFDRTTIELRLRDGIGIRAIAKHLGRSSGTICDEIKRHSGCGAYRAETAVAQSTESRRASGRKSRLAPAGALFVGISRLLRLRWSPEQISGRRKRIEDGMEQESWPPTIILAG